MTLGRWDDRTWQKQGESNRKEEGEAKMIKIDIQTWDADGSMVYSQIYPTCHHQSHVKLYIYYCKMHSDQNPHRPHPPYLARMHDHMMPL